MESQKDLSSENRTYWTGRAPGYSEVNRHELSTQQRDKWSGCLREEIERHFPGRPMEELRVLDVGTGPGFFAILLSAMGCRVTAVDLTPEMLSEAGKNAGELADRIRFLEMDAQSLEFPDGSFDLVVSRNLTWDLPDPAKAYAEWARVLADGGMMLIFDANWYAYLFDEKAREAYERDRMNSAEKGVTDQNVGENFDVMEDIARRLPLSGISRPEWDLIQLASCGLAAEADPDIWQRVWSEEEKLNFSSTPMFLVRAYR
ncbi:MAG: class I SAM-dependent methyltransferase [Oscillospiraceae bacterium]|nr:class I SAM-dependent methyltransferase [Oscillospiraceae bacterium]